jgi:hypothetical protein
MDERGEAFLDLTNALDLASGVGWWIKMYRVGLSIKRSSFKEAGSANFGLI